MNIKEFFIWLAAIIGIFAVCYFLSGCEAVDSIRRTSDEIGAIARDVAPVVKDTKKAMEEADSPRDWADIITKIAIGAGAVATAVGGEAYRRKRKKRKESL